LKNKPVVTADHQLKDTEQLASPAEEEQPPTPSFGTSLQLIDDDDCDQQTTDDHRNSEHQVVVSPTAPARRYPERH